MTSKHKAAAVAREERLTWGELKSMIEKSPMEGVSIVNPAIPLKIIAVIHMAVIDSHDLNEVPKAWRNDPYSGKPRPSRDFLIVTNILRDFSR